MRLPLRPDIRLRLYAVALGWEVEWPRYGDGMAFRKAGVDVWDASNGWRARDIDRAAGRYIGPVRVHGYDYEGLRRALETESPPPGSLPSFPTLNEEAEALRYNGWTVPPERDYAKFSRHAGGDDAWNILPVEGGDWALSHLSTRNIVAKGGDPLVLAAQVTSVAPPSGCRL